MGIGHRPHEYPSGAFRNLTSGVRPPSDKGERAVGGKLATQVRTFVSSPVVSPKPYAQEPRRPEARPGGSTRKSAEALEEVCAQSVEFVAVPDTAARLQATLPGAIRNAMQRVEGFAGCAVMVSEQEARLVTVVTFWRGKQRGQLAGANAMWVEQLLDPYMDRQLRTHRLRAQIALRSVTQTQSFKGDELASSTKEPNEPVL